jgi:1-acyl-sn-glycerol-3-phosphate acyltransferase
MSRAKKKYPTGQELEEAIEKNKVIYTEHYDKQFADGIIRNTLETIENVYFRSEMIGFEEHPERNHPDVPLIYASNHSGMAFPWDAMVFGAIMYRHVGHDFSKSFRPLSAPMLSQSNLMNPYMVPNLWKRVGAVDATTLNFETMMRQSEADVLIYPEGVPGIGKGFHKRYQLQKFSTSFIRMSLKYKTDIIPVHVINGEYIHPYSYASKSINKIVNMLGIPFLPISFILPFIIMQPWMFYHAFPSKLIYVRGKRISPQQWADKPFEEMSNEEIEAIRDRVHAQMQAEMNEAVEKYGKSPYRLKELFKKTWEHRKQFPFNYPFGWMLVFMEYVRRWEKGEGRDKPLIIDFKKESLLKMLWRNPMAIFYHVPLLGWLPLAYRGLKGRDKEIRMWKG